jgi:hypothetical protein
MGPAVWHRYWIYEKPNDYMKKQIIPSDDKELTKDLSGDSSFEEIIKELQILQRTQAPPSEELIAKLNKKASQPPFSFIHKKKDINIY